MAMNLTDILKGGTISPNDVALNGTLTPAQSRAFINVIKASSSVETLFKDVTVVRMPKLTLNRNNYDIQDKILTRHVAGVAQSQSKHAKVSNIGARLNATNGVELNFTIEDDTLLDNADNPTFEQDQFNDAVLKFNGELSILAMSGTADNASPDATFIELSKGFIQIAKDNDKTIKVETSETTVLGQLQVVTKNLDKALKGGRAVIYLSSTDYDAYQDELQVLFPTSGAIVQGNQTKYKGYSLRINHNIDEGTYLATLPKNMVIGLAGEVNRKRWYSNELSALRYKFVVYPDFEFDAYKFVTLVQYVAV